MMNKLRAFYSSISVVQWIMVLSLVSLTILQGYWLYANYLYKQEQMELNIRKALHAIRSDLRKANLKKIMRQIKMLNNENFSFHDISFLSDNERVKEFFFEIQTISENILLNFAEVYNIIIEHMAAAGIRYSFSFSIQSGEKIIHQSKDFNAAYPAIYQIHLTPDRKPHAPVLQIYFSDAEKDKWFSTILQAIVTLLFLGAIIWIYYQTYTQYNRQKQLLEIKNDFVNNMTHEFKTPIASISLAAQMLDEPAIFEKPELREQYLQLIHSENSKLQNLVEKILQAAKWEKHTPSLQYSEFYANELLLEVSEPFYYLAQEKHIGFEVSYLEEDMELRADKFLIQLALTNLLDNAFKYGANNTSPLIAIGARKENQNIIFFVKDNGKGLTKEEIIHIFDQFYRVPKGDRHDIKGFGLGMYFVKKIIDAHQGEIKILSKKYKETIFQLNLPLI